jgi:hypothetical protein
VEYRPESRGVPLEDEVIYGIALKLDQDRTVGKRTLWPLADLLAMIGGFICFTALFVLIMMKIV